MNRYLEDSQKDDLYRLNTSFVCLLWVRALKSVLAINSMNFPLQKTYGRELPLISLDGIHLLFQLPWVFNSKAGISLSPNMDENSSTFRRVLKSKCPHNQFNGKFTGTSSIFCWWMVVNPLVSSEVFPQTTHSPGLRCVNHPIWQHVACQRAVGDVPDGTGLVSPVQSCHHMSPGRGSERTAFHRYFPWKTLGGSDVIFPAPWQRINPWSQEVGRMILRYALVETTWHLNAVAISIQWCMRKRTITHPRSGIWDPTRTLNWRSIHHVLVFVNQDVWAYPRPFAKPSSLL